MKRKQRRTKLGSHVDRGPWRLLGEHTSETAHKCAGISVRVPLLFQIIVMVSLVKDKGSLDGAAWGPRSLESGAARKGSRALRSRYQKGTGLGGTVAAARVREEASIKSARSSLSPSNK